MRGSTKVRFTEERWQAMAAGVPYADAQCLLAYDDRGNAVAAASSNVGAVVTYKSAGFQHLPEVRDLRARASCERED